MTHGSNDPAAQQSAPWWWRLCGLILIGAGVLLALMPRLLSASEWWVYLIYFVSAPLFAAIGVLFLRTKPAPSAIRCAHCGRESKRSRLYYYCAGCGRSLEPDKDDLDPSEINCPFCEGPVRKGANVCPSCSKALPGFGVDAGKGGAFTCRWCHTAVASEDRFCKYCSAPLPRA